MPKLERLVLRIPARGKSREVASFFAQLDDQSRLLFAELADIKPAELEWQPKRGMNTIGMLLAHNAIVEAFWLLTATGVSTAVEADAMMTKIFGVNFDVDGMPIPPDGVHPRSLRGWTLAKYRALHDKVRAFAKKRAATLTDADLEVTFRRTRANGQVRILNPRWILYHVLEHQCGHYGQMLLLRHQYRDRRRK